MSVRLPPAARATRAGAPHLPAPIAMADVVDTDRLIANALCVAAAEPQVYTVYGYTIFQHFIAPHLRRDPSDLDMFAVASSADEFRRLASALVVRFDDSRVYFTETYHDDTVSCHFRCGPARFLDLTWETPASRVEAEANHLTHPMRIEQAGVALTVSARSELWFYRQVEGVLRQPAVGAHRYRWRKDMHNVHLVVASMVWAHQSGGRLHSMPWMDLEKYSQNGSATSLHQHAKPVRQWLGLLFWHLVCRCIVVASSSTAPRPAPARTDAGTQASTAHHPARKDACTQASTSHHPARKDACTQASTSHHPARRDAGTQVSAPRPRVAVSTQTSAGWVERTPQVCFERRRWASADAQVHQLQEQLRVRDEERRWLRLQVEKLQKQRQRWILYHAQLPAKAQILRKLMRTIPVEVQIGKMVAGDPLLRDESEGGAPPDMEWGQRVATAAAHLTRSYSERVMEQMLQMVEKLTAGDN